METTAIIGLGMLGTSLALALRGTDRRIVGWTRRREVSARLLAAGALDAAPNSIEEVLQTADVTILALPIPQILSYIDRYAQAWRPGSVVTDLGSVKGAVMAAAAKPARHGVIFIGGHPMAGTEKSGPDAAFPELFNNADVFLTLPEPVSPPVEAAAKQLEKLWNDAGARVRRIACADHDALVACTSHVLHVIASALTTAILDAPDEPTRLRRFEGCATGFRDTSRIASSNPLMWREIIENNQPAVLEALRSFGKRCGHLTSLIESGDFDEFEREFARGKALRDEWLKYKGF